MEGPAADHCHRLVPFSDTTYPAKVTDTLKMCLKYSKNVCTIEVI